jgi:hypothetical protein
MEELQPVRLAGIPAPLTWALPPLEWETTADGALAITAGPRTDLFIDPQQTAVFENAPRLLFTPEGDFMLQARVTVGFASTYDAGVLLVYAADRLWGKLCFEFSPQRDPMIVSVVTRDYSDDANSAIVQGNTVLLRVARLGHAFAFHWSHDGTFWHFVRHFSLPGAGTIRAGFVSQSPTGERCTARFSDIMFIPERLQDLRSGV